MLTVTYTNKTTNSNSSVYYLEIYDTQNNLIAKRTTIKGTDGVVVSKYALNKGTYFIVTSALKQAVVESADYTVRADFLSARIEKEPNDEAATATPLPLDKSISGIFSGTRDTDMFRIKLFKRQTITVAFEHTVYGSVPGYYYSIVDIRNSKDESFLDFEEGVLSLEPNQKSGYLTCTLNPGTYYISAGSSFFNTIFSYTEYKLTVATNPEAVGLVSTVANGYKSIDLKWNALSNVSGYQICRATSKNGIYTRIANVSSGTNTYKDTNLKTGQTYYYKVRAYRNASGRMLYGAFSAVKYAKPILSTPRLYVSRYNSTVSKLTWSRVSGAHGYQIYRSNTLNGTYTLIKTITGNDVIHYYNKGLQSNRNYYYKVVAIRTVDGKTVCSKPSAIRQIV